MKRRILSVLLTAVLSMSLMACGTSNGGGAASSASSDGAGTAEIKSIKVAGNPFIGAGPNYVAMKKGIFEKYGLNVELVEFNDTSESVSALLAGRVDVAGGTLDAIMIAADQNSENMPVVFSIQDDSAGADGIVAVNGIDSVEGLKGKKVGVALNQTTHLLLAHALEEVGLTDADVEIIDMNSSDAGISFISGSLDGAVTWEPYLSNAADSGVGSMIYSSADAPGLIMDVLCVSQATLNGDDNEWVVNYMKAVDEAKDFINSEETKDEAFTIIGEYLGIDAAEAEEAWATVTMYSSEEIVTALGNGGNGEKVVATINDFYTKKGTMSSAVDATALFTTKFAEMAK